MKQLSPLVVIFALANSGGVALADCPVTLPSSSPVKVPGVESSTTHAWYGSEALAVKIPVDGRWKGMGPSRNFFDKFWVWRRGYSPKAEPVPALTFAGVKLHDGDQPQRMQVEEATNAFGPGWTSMLTGLEFPSAGCWQVSAKYVYAGITHDLTFIVDVFGE